MPVQRETARCGLRQFQHSLLGALSTNIRLAYFVITLRYHDVLHPNCPRLDSSYAGMDVVRETRPAGSGSGVLVSAVGELGRSDVSVLTTMQHTRVAFTGHWSARSDSQTDLLLFD